MLDPHHRVSALAPETQSCDALPEDTHPGLSDLRYFFSEWEAGLHAPPNRDPEDAWWCAALSEFQGMLNASHVPSYESGAQWVELVFARWREADPSRMRYRLECAPCMVDCGEAPDDTGPGIMCRLGEQSDAD